MKNSILFLFATIVIVFYGNSQVIYEDDFESYNLGDMGVQNPTIWSVWNGDPAAGGGITVVDLGGNQAGYIGPGSLQDALLLLGNISSGDYELLFDMFISTGSTGYFNIQGETETNPGTGYQGAGAGGAGVFNSGNLYFNQDGANPGLFLDQTTGETATYPEDAWFPVFFYFDVDNLTYSITIDGNLVNIIPVPFQSDSTLGAIDFFSIDANNNYWIDNVVYNDGFIFDVDDFASENFSLYPNPVIDVLNIRSSTPVTEIQVYNVLGKLILKDSPQAISPRMDMSALSTGVYLIRVSIGDTSKTFKVVR